MIFFPESRKVCLFYVCRSEKLHYFSFTFLPEIDQESACCSSVGIYLYRFGKTTEFHRMSALIDLAFKAPAFRKITVLC